MLLVDLTYEEAGDEEEEEEAAAEHHALPSPLQIKAMQPIEPVSNIHGLLTVE